MRCRRLRASRHMGTVTAVLLSLLLPVQAVVVFSPRTYTVQESVGTIFLQLVHTLSEVRTVQVKTEYSAHSLLYEARPGVDYTHLQSSFTFEGRVTHRAVPLTILDDQVVNAVSSRTIRVTLTDTTSGQLLSEAIVIILDDELNECLQQPCRHGGTCAQTPTSYACSCPAPYVGKDCAQLNPCASENPPCLNGGKCSVRRVTPYYQCACMEPYGGTNCEHSQACASTPCAIGGNCVNTPGTPPFYSCECQRGWTGLRCSVGDPCDTSEICTANGGCVTTNSPPYYRCQCRSGFDGQNCQISAFRLTLVLSVSLAVGVLALVCCRTALVCCQCWRRRLRRTLPYVTMQSSL